MLLASRPTSVNIHDETTTDRFVPQSEMAAVDLFAGAGGLALGLSRSGFSIGLGSDHWKAASDTYMANFPSHPYVQADVRDITVTQIRNAVAGRPWVLAGGPPCQGFSSAGRRQAGDARNSLVGLFAMLAAESQPDVVIFENVEGFLTAEGGRYVFDLLDPLIDAGYAIALRKVNVANYGVPQLRKRVVAIATLRAEPIIPDATHFAFGAPGASSVARHLPPTRTIEDVLRLQNKGRANLSWNDVRELNETDSQRVSALRQGQTMRDLPAALRHPSYLRRANRRVADGMPTERRGGAPAGVRRLMGGEPSKAITGAASREFIHPFEDRFLTLRECAMLQTFPADFEFVGSAAEVATLIGNAVPPDFAHSLGCSAAASIGEIGKRVTPGLREFSITEAASMSPALQLTHDSVSRRFGLGTISEQLALV